MILLPCGSMINSESLADNIPKPAPAITLLAHCRLFNIHNKMHNSFNLFTIPQTYHQNLKIF